MIEVVNLSKEIIEMYLVEVDKITFQRSKMNLSAIDVCYIEIEKFDGKFLEIGDFVLLRRHGYGDETIFLKIKEFGNEYLSLERLDIIAIQ